MDEVDGCGAAGRDSARGVGCDALSPLWRCRAGGGAGDAIGKRFGDTSRIPESALAFKPDASGSDKAATMSMSMA